MSTADWVVIAVVAVAGLYGISTGFLRGAFSLAGFAFGAYLGARLAPLILSDGSPYVPVVALGGAILLGTLMRGLAGMLAGVLRTSIGVIPGMRLLDRFAGLVLGLVAGVFLCWAIGAVLLYLPGETDLRRSVQRSAILSEINDVVPARAAARGARARRPDRRVPRPAGDRRAARQGRSRRIRTSCARRRASSA